MYSCYGVVCNERDYYVYVTIKVCEIHSIGINRVFQSISGSLIFSKWLLLRRL